MECPICEMKCDIEDGGIGGCGMYVRSGAEIRERYPGRFLAAVDTAIECMPMVHYHPRGKFLQVCTVGCNFKCQGCVSWVLTDHLSAVEGAFQEMTPEQIVGKALAEACLGVMFCFNEPTVSYFTFRQLARAAREAGLLVGCSTNGYMTESALEGLVPFLDFVNVGLKGISNRAYRPCGVKDPAPIRRNLEALHKAGVHIEVSAVFHKQGEAELAGVAGFVASLSREIPLQVMRFIPFGDADSDLEPSVREAEAVCRQLRRQLRYVYLFNSPGSEDLHSRCPDCGAKIMERGFFGPMASNLFRYMPDAACICGFRLPIRGEIHDSQVRETGYFGGYRTISALNMIRALLGVIGVTDRERIDAVLIRVLREDFIKDLYERLNHVDFWLDTLEYFAALAGEEGRAVAFRRYVGDRIAFIDAAVAGRERPAVYCSLGHPLIAVFEEKLECRLVEMAGGRLTNRMLARESRPGITISGEQFRRMAPDIIIVSDAAAWPVEDFIAWCKEHDLNVPAVRNGNVFHTTPYRASINPDWILGVMRLAQILHPDVFPFDLCREAEDFCREFFNMPFGDGLRRTLPWLRRK
jgi:pyruvate-formate lyase-activating enzyme